MDCAVLKYILTPFRALSCFTNTLITCHVMGSHNIILLI